MKEYSHNRSNVIMNFSIKYCVSQEELLNSVGFKNVLQKYIEKLQKNNTVLYEELIGISDEHNLSTDILDLFRLLIILDSKTIINLYNVQSELLKANGLIIEFIEGLYNYWRSLERYAIILTDPNDSGIQNVSFIEASNNFLNLVLKTYRRIEENILGYEHSVYRQLSAGINAGIVLSGKTNNFDKNYDYLNGVNIIKQIVLNTPFTIYPKQNKRSGLFEEVYENPLEELKINKSHYFCFPAKVGESLAFVYFHRNYVNHGVSLCNLFEIAKLDEYKNRKPDLVYVFGQRTKEQVKKTVFYHDRKEHMYVAFTASHNEIDYFGYMKKMILTIHNVRMIDKGILPIHGAMVSVTMKDGRQANIAIMGDSGAGKSESLEAFRKLSSKYLKEIKIIFDDMGTFQIIDGKVVGFGTEIGAFVRLDDLDPGYAYQEMDRAIFMNPDKTNARLLIPVTQYSDVVKGYEVDMFLYANNYTDETEVLQFLSDKEEAKQVFKRALRKAKGTTSETGIVESYFANPFGVLQRKKQSEIVIEKVFDTLYKNNIVVGVIYTKLAIEGKEFTGPEEAADNLFQWIMKK